MALQQILVTAGDCQMSVGNEVPEAGSRVPMGGMGRYQPPYFLPKAVTASPTAFAAESSSSPAWKA